MIEKGMVTDLGSMNIITDQDMNHSHWHALSVRCPRYRKRCPVQARQTTPSGANGC